MKKILSSLAFAALTCFSQAQTQTQWDYTWTAGVDTLDGNNDGGTWQSVSFSQNTTTNILDVNISMTNSADSNEATVGLWMSITNGPTPTTTSPEYAGIYLYAGSFYVTPYSESPVVSHTIPTTILQGTYTNTPGPGGLQTFSFNLDTSVVNSWQGSPSGTTWKGIGFPYDATNSTAGNSSTPFRMGAWIRSFEADGLVSDGVDWKVDFADGKEANVGTWDVSHDFQVPEPSSTALLGLGVLGAALRRRR